MDFLNDQDHYVKSYNVFKKSCKATETTVTCMNEFLYSFLNRYHRKKKMSSFRPIRILSIGSGEGDVDKKVIEFFKNRYYRHIHYTVVEPFESQIRRFKERVIGTPRISGVTFEVNQMTCEEFISTERKSTYDMILFIHVLYYVKNDVGILLDYNSILSEGGCMIIVQNIPEKVEPSDNHESIDIDTCMKRSGLQYYKKELMYNIDIGPLLVDNPDQISREGDLLLDFMTHVKNYRQSVPPAAIQRFIQTRKEEAEYEDGKWILSTYAVAYFI